MINDILERIKAAIPIRYREAVWVGLGVIFNTTIGAFCVILSLKDIYDVPFLNAIMISMFYLTLSLGVEKIDLESAMEERLRRMSILLAGVLAFSLLKLWF